ncbi:13994_t:CDS:2 [Entrophospora sp. SA101]|nr:9664_t:CDS:2 [Entrophospora sp. SA101]CAJ0764801.1 13994_t:CDS:2 [Entrophospora sp. SA101]CAJ0835644.1 17557_t:CDS:2 [Entrophospora sp. SA101]CAJ0844115.1 5442_t:CDS:2 [Entrophospora sp. SA101]
MKTFFETIKRSYTEVPINEEGIDTIAFLEATEGLVQLFDLLGSTAFSIVQNDMNGNIKKIQAKYDTDPSKNNSLENLIKNEAGEKKRVATEGLLWLKRGLELTSVALRRSINNVSEELSVSFTMSYGETLKQYHNFVVKSLFTVAMKACPYREEFFKKLGDDQEVVIVKYKEWLGALEVIVKRLDDFYVKNGYDKGFK